MNTTLHDVFRGQAGPADYAKAYAARLEAMLAALDYKAIEAIAHAIEQASQAGRTVYFAANGGSAACAAHWVNDMVAGGHIAGQPGFRAASLADNVPTVTALGNDAGYDNVFVRQLEVMLNPGDVLLVMSVSGNSENLVRAVEFARTHGATTIAITGMDGGRLRGRCIVDLHIPSAKDDYGPVEDCFAIIEHMVVTYLIQRRGKALHH